MYDMLERLLKLRNYIDKAAKYNSALKIDENMWMDISAVVDVCEPFKAMMVKIQAPNVCVNDFFLSWKKTMLKLTKKKLPDGTARM